MALSNVRDERFPAHYNHLLMDWRRVQLGFSLRGLARLLGYHHSVMVDVFHGRATSKTVYPVVRALELDWAKVHDLTLRESDYPHSIRIDAPGGAHLIAPKEVVKQ